VAILPPCEVLTAELKEYVPARRKFITYQNLIIYFVTFITKLTIYMNETNISQHYSFSCRTISLRKIINTVLLSSRGWQKCLWIAAFQWDFIEWLGAIIKCCRVMRNTVVLRIILRTKIIVVTVSTHY
jgi:hypothetical protein